MLEGSLYFFTESNDQLSDLFVRGNFIKYVKNMDKIVDQGVLEA